METETIVEWQSPEHHFEKRTADWYWILGIVAAGGAVLSIYFGNFLFSIFLVLSALTIGFLSYKETKPVGVRVTAQGIVLGRYLYPFRSHRSFWLQDDHVHGPRILLHPLSSLSPLTIIPVSEEIDLEKLHGLLSEFLDEEYLEESLIHKIFDRIGL